MSWFSSIKSIISIWKFWKKGDVNVKETSEGYELERRINKTTKEKLTVKIGDSNEEDSTPPSPAE